MSRTAKQGAVLAGVLVLIAAVAILVLNRGPETNSAETNGSENGPETNGPETKSYTQAGAAMEPLLSEGERFEAEVVDDYEPHRGDVIVFEDPGGWLGDFVHDGLLVKRVIGIPGDTIVCCDKDGRLSVNGEPQDESGYIEMSGIDCAGPMTGSCDWTAGPVPDDGLFVMGDNRANSADSTIHMCRVGDEDCDPDRAYVSIVLVRAVMKDEARVAPAGYAAPGSPAAPAET